MFPCFHVYICTQTHTFMNRHTYTLQIYAYIHINLIVPYNDVRFWWKRSRCQFQKLINVCVCMCVCVCARARVCVCVCVWSPPPLPYDCAAISKTSPFLHYFPLQVEFYLFQAFRELQKIRQRASCKRDINVKWNMCNQSLFEYFCFALPRILSIRKYTCSTIICNFKESLQ